jgi:hypothetical protein
MQSLRLTSYRRVHDITRKRRVPSRLSKRMARPVRKQFWRSDLTSLHQRIRPMGHSPGQDGDPHVPVLIKLTASERHF